MPIYEKELTHDCVWLQGAQTSYQYVRLIISFFFLILNLMLPRVSFTPEISVLWLLLISASDMRIWKSAVNCVCWFVRRCFFGSWWKRHKKAFKSHNRLFLIFFLDMLSFAFIFFNVFPVKLFVQKSTFERQRAQSKDFCLSFCGA